MREMNVNNIVPICLVAGAVLFIATMIMIANGLQFQTAINSKSIHWGKVVLLKSQVFILQKYFIIHHIQAVI